MTIDGRRFYYRVNELPFDESGAVPLQVGIRADFGTKSYCKVTGLTNREYWHDFPDWDPDAIIQITPRIFRKLILYGLSTGWDPASSHSNFTFAIDNSFVAGK